MKEKIQSQLLKFRTIKYRLILFVTLLVFLPSFMITWHTYEETVESFQNRIEENLNTLNQTFHSVLEGYISKGINYGSIFSNDKSIENAVRFMSGTKNNAYLLRIIQSYQKSLDINNISYVSNEGVVWARGHLPEKFNDSKQDFPFTKRMSESKETLWDYEVEENMVAMTFGVPVFQRNRYSGYLSYGYYLNNKYLGRIKTVIDSDLAFVLKKGKKLIASTNSKFSLNMINQEYLNASLKNVKEIEFEREMNGKFYSLIYFPVLGPDKEVFGSVVLFRDITSLVEHRREIILFSFIISIFFLIVGVILIILLTSKLVSTPLNIFSDLFMKAALGDLAVRYPTKEIDCNEVTGCGNEECDAYDNELVCWFEVGSWATGLGKEVQCPKIVNNVYGSCQECKVYQTVCDNEISTIGMMFNFFMTNLSKIIGTTVNLSSNLAQTSNTLASSSEQMSGKSKEIDEKVANITEASTVITHNIDTIAAGTEEASINVNAMSNGLEHLSKNIEEVAVEVDEANRNMAETRTNIEQISNKIASSANSLEKVSDSLNSVNEQVRDATSISNDANKNAQETLNVMTELESTARNIGRIVSLTGDIADQTNMLSLNATIEAASAGDAGKGFAVVASEIKNLAQQTSNANQEITSEIEKIQRFTKSSLDKTQSVSKVIQEVARINGFIASSMEEQNRVVREISATTDDISEASQQSASIVNEAAARQEKISQAATSASKESEMLSNQAQEATHGVKEVAHSCSNAAAKTREVNQSIQSIQSDIEDVNQSVLNNRKDAHELSNMSISLKESVSIFNIDKKEKE